MMTKQFFTSITRNSDLSVTPFNVRALPLSEWDDGDYVVCEVSGTPGSLYRVELVTGRRTPVLPGDRIIGALGRRAATHECVGDWRETGDDMMLHQLTGAGLIGKVVSNSSWVGRPMSLRYMGHTVRGRKVTVADFVTPVETADFTLPTVLVAGTSMSVGKTLTMRIIINQLAQLGVRVAAAKLAGAAGYKDALSYGDAGADFIIDYVDAGLVSSVCDPADYQAALETLLDRVGGSGAEIAVCEIGASPLEPYNGQLAIDRLRGQIVLTALCAADAYAAEGFRTGCGIEPDFVTGPAANNSASSALVRKLTGLPSLDLGSEDGIAALTGILNDRVVPSRKGEAASS